MIRQAEANLENSRQNLAYCKIKAPENGIVIERKVDEGQTVVASYQTPDMFTLGVEMDKHVYIFASVDEADVGLIRSAQKRFEDQKTLATLAAVVGRLGQYWGQPENALAAVGTGDYLVQAAVQFTVDAYPDELFTGTIYQIRMNSTTTQNVVTYPIVIDAPNPGMKLMPGMTASLTFHTAVREDVLRVPAAALRFFPTADQVRPEDRHHVDALPTTTANEDTGPQTATEKADLSRKRQRRLVWVKEGELLRAVPVVLGLIENQFAELLEGDLTEGQEVVTGTEGPYSSR